MAWKKQEVKQTQPTLVSLIIKVNTLRQVQGFNLYHTGSQVGSGKMKINKSLKFTSGQGKTGWFYFCVLFCFDGSFQHSDLPHVFKSPFAQITINPLLKNTHCIPKFNL